MSIWDKLTGNKLKETLATLNTRSGIRKKKLEQSHASYWLGDEAEEIYHLDLSDTGATFEQASKLASVKRAIANFVSILTGKDIPVHYSSGQQSMTDGKCVIISADTSKKVFDTTVGLALHEASHILKSNFDYVRSICDARYFAMLIPSELWIAGHKLGMSDALIASTFKDIVNILEDRRIDYFIYKTAPGYRPYYEALYATYFNDTQIDIALITESKNDPAVENYFFHLCNMTNALYQPTALPGLPEITKLIDLPNILRFDNDDYTYFMRVGQRPQTPVDQTKMPKLHQLAVAVVAIIFENSVTFESPNQGQGGQQKQEKQKSDSKEQNLDQSSGGGEGEGESENEGDGEGDEDKNEGEGGDEDDEGEGSSDKDKDSDKKTDKETNKETNKETDKEKKQAAKEAAQRAKLEGRSNPKKLAKAIANQKKFIRGEISKEKITKSLETMVGTVEESGATYYEAGKGDIFGRNASAPVVVISKVSRKMLESSSLPLAAKAGIGELQRYPYSEAAVTEGYKLGSALASRLIVRNLEKVTRYTRQDKGRIDKRLVANLGYECEQVFSHEVVDSFDPVDLHISIDSSGSMVGMKWQQAMTVAIAVAYAASRISNLRVVISMREGMNSGEALIAVLYDSAIDKLTKIRSLFPYLRPTGSTPEGLAFEAITDLIVNTKKNTKKYFLNLSDGQPYFVYYPNHTINTNTRFDYVGDNAVRHTAQQIKKFRDSGVEVLSYFIRDGNSTVGEAMFRTMYGKNASFIDPKNVTGIVATLNKLFLSKD